MMKPFTPRQQTLIVNNILRACEDIEYLNNVGYRYIMQCSGFIAHYNLYGFRDAYSQPGSLARNILSNHENNRWENFRPGERDYAYYEVKKIIYQRIVNELIKNPLYDLWYYARGA